MVDGRAEKTLADIAIIGMACLFPGAADVRRYWQNICRGLDAVREVPSERWRSEDFYSQDRLARDRVYSRWGAFLDPVVFDPVKWHIPPASLRHIEPMQLLSLEMARQALADAGYVTNDEWRVASGEKNAPSSLATRHSPLATQHWRERAGVLFAVPGSHELGAAYCFRTMMRHYLPGVEGLSVELRERIYAGLEEQLPEWSEDSFPGFLGNVIAGRIARAFDFHGPNFTVDAACAASLAAVFTAVQFLRSGTADLMLVGGADGTNNPFGFMSFAKTHALSPRGKSRAFDASGDGIALGEGVAVIVLKRLADAQRDGDNIHAVIKGVGSSSDGKNRSLTAPYPPGQMRAVERAYEDAGISPASVTLIEAHGTGTAVGDAAELNTLTQVFAPHTEDRQYVAVGSVKSMIGHTKTVAGLASLIKTALALKHRVLPPTLHVEKPCAQVDLANRPFYLNTETRPWIIEDRRDAGPTGEQPRRAGVSAFGFGGTNFHVVLEEFNAAEAANWTPRAVELFVFRRVSRAELLGDLRQLQQQIQTLATEDLAGLAAAVFADEKMLDTSPKRQQGDRGTLAGALPVGAPVGARSPDRAPSLTEGLPFGEEGDLRSGPGAGSGDPAPTGESGPGAGSGDPPPTGGSSPGAGSGDPPPTGGASGSCPRVCRLALVAGSVEDLRQKLHKAATLLPERAEFSDPSGIYYSEAAPVRDTEVCFLYPGQGSQSVNMLRDLAVGCPWSHDLFLEANRLLNEDLPQPLTRFLYPPPVFDDAARQQQTAALRDTRIAQPALAVVELFATELLQRFGIRPAFAAGHSYGEHTALQVAGCLSRTDLLRLSAHRGRVCAEAAAACPGAMAAVGADAATVETALRELNLSVWTANRNATDQTVIAGPVAAIDAAVEQLSRRGLGTCKLPVSAAFHTPLLSAASETMREYLAGIYFTRPRLPVYSNTTGQRHAEEPDRIRELLACHLCRPVLFEQEVRQLHADGARVFVEVGPGKVLTDLVARILKGKSVAALALDTPGRDGWTQLGHLLARLTVLGLPVRLAAWFEKRGLTAGSLSEFLAQTRAAKSPKATDWILSPNKACLLSAHKEKWTAKNVPRMTMEATMTTNGVGQAFQPNGVATSDPRVGTTEPAVPTTSELFVQFQATTRLLLEAQQAQNRVLERYLETQERLLLHCGQNGSVAKKSLETRAMVSPPAPRVRPPVPIPRIPSAPPTTDARPASRSQALLGNASSRSSASHPVADRDGKQSFPTCVPKQSLGTRNGNGSSMPAPRAAVNGEVPPPTETFRRDLLDIVSARTGYPIDALDENLALEAELGIDSIKTVEIFSNLKAYHAYFRAEEQEEEDLLAEFTKLKTLRDIIDAYDRRRQALIRRDATPSEAKKENGAIQRYVLTSAAAPLEPNGEKKNGRMDSFS